MLTLAATDERRQILHSVLAASSFVDGQNLTVVQRLADERLDRLDGLAVELKAARVGAIVIFGYPGFSAFDDPSAERSRMCPLMIICETLFTFSPP